MVQKLVTGIDLVEIERIAESMKNPRFLERVFSQEELNLFLSRAGTEQCTLDTLHQHRSVISTAAANFCAKEAFSKALGTGVRGFALNEVSVLRDELGKPFLVLAGNAQRIVRERKLELSVSLTHTKEFASAVVVGMVSK